MVVVMLGVLLSALGNAQQALPPLAELKAAAEKGDPIAQDQLGDVFQKSLDNTNAEKWYRQAAAKGVVNSQYKLGHILMIQTTYTTIKADARSSFGE
jgi:TPR repeat protein